MTQRQLVSARGALEGLCAREWPFREAYALAALIRALSPAYEFQMAQEERLLKKHHGEIKGEGVAVFETPDARAAFEADLKALGDMEQEIPACAPVKLSAREGLMISPKELNALDGFVSFEGV